MKNNRIYLFFIVFNILFCISVSFADKADEAIKDFCNCAKPAYAKHKEIMEAVKVDLLNNPGNSQTRFANIEKETLEIVNCFNSIEKKYAAYKNNSDFDSKVKKGIERECPKPKSS